MPRKYTYTRRRVSRKGRIDGRGWRWKFWPLMKSSFPVHPAPGQVESALYEHQLLKAGEDVLSDLAAEWSHLDKALKTKYCETLVRLEQTTNQMDLENKEFQVAKRNYDEAAMEFNFLQSPAFSKPFEWTCIVVLAIAEYYFNYMIFSVLGSSKADTMITAATISIALPLSALAFGHTLRIDNKNLTHRLWVVVLILIPFFVFLAIAFLRAALFEAAWEQSVLKLSLTPTQATIAFIVINLLIWLIAAFVSYRASHRDPEMYRTLRIKLVGARHVMEREGSQYKEAVRQYEKARMSHEKAKHWRKEEFDYCCSRGMDLIKSTKWLISVYRTCNQQARRDGVMPPCFHTTITELPMPMDLHESKLDWNCDLTASHSFHVKS